MSKQGQIDAFEAFCKAIEADKKKDPAGCYFEELLQHRQLIIRNIKDDIIPFVGVFTTQKHLDSIVAKWRDNCNNLKAAKLNLSNQLLVAKQHDVRELNKRRKEIEQEENRLKEEAKAIDKKLTANL